MYHTEFGKAMREIRAKRDTTMAEMAQALGVSAAAVSAVETGKKAVPSRWIDEIAAHYGLSENERAGLWDAADESRAFYRIDVKGASPRKRRAAAMLARSFGTMDDDTALAIIKAIETEGERNAE